MSELHRILDKAAERFNLDHVKLHPSGGFLTLELPVTRAGVFRYYDEAYDGCTRRDLKTIEELSSESFVDSLLGLPLVDLHPEFGLVDTANAKDANIVGAVHPKVSYNAVQTQEELRSDGLVRMLFTVFHADAIDAIQRGDIAETSLGATCTRVFQPGQLSNGTAFDAMQTNLVNNHLALVPLARAGSCTNIAHKFFSDSAYDGLDILGDRAIPTIEKAERKKTIYAMPTKTKAAETADQSDELQSKLTATEQLLKDSQAEVATLKAEAITAEEENADLVTIDAARDLAKKAVALSVAAKALGHEVALDELLDKPGETSIAIAAKVSDGKFVADSFPTALAYLQGKAESVPVKAGQTLGDALGEAANKGKAKNSKMSDRRKASHEKLYA